MSPLTKVILKRVIRKHGERLLIDLLQQFANKSDNKIDDALVGMVATALSNKSYKKASPRRKAGK